MKLKSLIIPLFVFLTITTNVYAYSVIPYGKAVGVIVRTDGVLVAGTTKITDVNGRSVNPAKKSGIIKGDRIVSVNGATINTIDELSEYISDKAYEIELGIIRNGKQKNVIVVPVTTTSGNKLGILVKDATAGIGTITFIDPLSGKYAGLGHCITDLDTGNILPINGGNILKCDLTEPTKGKSGIPGELNGEFIDSVIGTVNINSSNGIFGKINDTPSLPQKEICPPEDVKSGAAYILADVDGRGVQRYSVNITNINLNDATGKNMVIEITDKELISITGGIVQGMSGAPIIRDDMIIGAVTHVFVDNPKKGYGIFANTMLADIE